MNLPGFSGDKPTFTPAPADVDKRLRRGRSARGDDASKRRLCGLFLKGQQYNYITNSGSITSPAVNLGPSSGRPPHRIRNNYNFIRPIIDAKVATVTTRPPGYEINPTGTDPTVVEAAQLAEKVARMGYEAWYLREARVKAAELAVGGGGRAYGLPYFDSGVGPFIQTQNPDGSIDVVGEGEIKVMVLNGNEVVWEPGVEFHHSRWYGVDTARPISEVEQMADYIGGPLSSDAVTGEQAQDAPTKDMVMVTMYFERPCLKWPDGRMLTLANGRQILPSGPYPLRKDDVAIDKPCLHQLVYRSTDGDLGLTWELIDFQRTASDCYNKIVELKNRALNLRIMAPKGSLPDGPPTDEPGSITYFVPVGGHVPAWEQAPDPNIMQQLMSVLARTLEDMRYVAADADITAAPNVAAGALQAVQQQSANRWSQFVNNFARWDADIASHCLLLAQEHYTENRTLKIRGRYGWEPVSSFKGAQIMGQIDVTVNPNTIESQSRTAILQQLGWIQANFPGFLRPEVAIDIVMTGTSPESVIESYEQDKSRMNMIIQHIRAGTVMDMGWRNDTIDGPPYPLTGAPTKQLAQVPAWMPRAFDNVDIQLWVLEGWLKTDESTRLPPQYLETAMLVYEGMKHLQQQQAAAAQAAQDAKAMALGGVNAAKPQANKPMPSTPNPAVDPGAAPQ